VKLFYGYWLNFKSTRSFTSYGKKYDTKGAPNRVVRQLLQQKNRIEKEKARNLFSEQVGGHTLPPPSFPPHSLIYTPIFTLEREMMPLLYFIPHSPSLAHLIIFSKQHTRMEKKNLF
jgi:hypothetical protein